MIITKDITCLIEEFEYDNNIYLLKSHFQNETLLVYSELYQKQVGEKLLPLFISNTDEYINTIYSSVQNKILTHTFYMLHTYVDNIFYNIELLINLISEELEGVSIYSGNCTVNLQSDFALCVLAECPKAINPAIH